MIAEFSCFGRQKTYSLVRAPTNLLHLATSQVGKVEFQYRPVDLSLASFDGLEYKYAQGY